MSDNKIVTDFSRIVEFLKKNYIIESNNQIIEEMKMHKPRFYGLMKGTGYRFGHADIEKLKELYGEPFQNFFDNGLKEEVKKVESITDDSIEKTKDKYMIRYIELNQQFTDLYYNMNDKFSNLKTKDKEYLEDVLKEAAKIKENFKIK
jgi:hypothetical protein